MATSTPDLSEHLYTIAWRLQGALHGLDMLAEHLPDIRSNSPESAAFDALIAFLKNQADCLNSAAQTVEKMERAA